VQPWRHWRSAAGGASAAGTGAGATVVAGLRVQHEPLCLLYLGRQAFNQHQPLVLDVGSLSVLGRVTRVERIKAADVRA
jgi:hypothetical protein